MEENNNRIIQIASFFIIILFWLLLGSTIVNLYVNISFTLDNNNTFFNSELYQYIGANLPFLSMWLGFYFCFKYINNIKIKTIINSSNYINKKLFINTFIISIIFFILITFLGSILNLYDLSFLENKTRERLIILPFILILTPIQTAAEEILFRGVLLKIFTKTYDNFKFQKRPLLYAILISILIGMIFILPHLFNPEIQNNFISAILYYFIFGSLATLSIQFSKGLEIAIAIHLSNNLMVAILCNYENSALTSIPFFLKSNETIYSKYFELITLIILFIIIGFINRKTIKTVLTKEINN